jgi:CHASE3 domain sensor protein
MSAATGMSSYTLRKRLATTPGRLQVSLILGYLGVLLLFVATLNGANLRRSAMKTVAIDSAPSVIAAKRIGASLADADSNLANYLLGHGDLNKQALQTYNSRMREVREALIDAAQNITYGEKERRPILRLQNGRDRCVELAAQAVLEHDRNDTPAAVARYREVTRIVHQDLLPAADDLDQANKQEMNQAYERVRWSAGLNLTLVLLIGGALALLLLSTQQYLTRKTHRRFHPLLAAATVLTLAFLAYSVRIFLHEARDLKVAKEDSFESIHALWQARAVSYDANGEESRWLLDRKNAAVFEKAFFDKAARVAQPPDHQSFDSVAHAALGGDVPAGFQGYLANELRNITFTGEREAAADAVKRFGEYFRIDGRIRSLENRGQHAEAVELCIGSQKGESNYAFDQFDKRLGDVIDINQQEFDRAAARGMNALARFGLLAAVVSLAAAALIGLGLRPRLKEYSF